MCSFLTDYDHTYFYFRMRKGKRFRPVGREESAAWTGYLHRFSPGSPKGIWPGLVPLSKGKRMDEQNIREFYDATAPAYARGYLHELDHKPFDRFLLQRFVSENKGKGPIADLGCGPGHTTKYLSELGIRDLAGIDLSTGMLQQAREHFPGLRFEAGNMLALDAPADNYGAIVALYSIVHFRKKELVTFFAEMYRLLKPGGQLLLSFHIGDEVKTVDELLGVKASADFYFHPVEKIHDLMTAQGFRPIDTMTRYPYPEEFPNNRAYLLAMK